ncbi:hypothetical protein, partial [Celeribacter litoreus]|uniref:hypothetical protein n=1 Tax=Celeribacter litoreus TaxID=2876714 RepID=UPI001CCFC418
SILPSVGRIESASHTPIKRAFFNGIGGKRPFAASCVNGSYTQIADDVESIRIAAPDLAKA